MKNDSFFFPFSTPADGFFDSNGDGELSGFESAMRDSWLYESQKDFNENLDDSDDILDDSWLYADNYKYRDDLYGQKEDYNDSYSEDEDSDEQDYDDDAWREDAVQDPNLELNPYDYDNEYDFIVAKTKLLAEKVGVDPDKYDDPNELLDAIGEVLKYTGEVNKDDYPNERQYDAAVKLSGEYGYDDNDSKRCRFILENADKITAANYLTSDGKFIFSQAIKDNFTLPCALPDEDNEQEMWLDDILAKLARYDIPLMLKVWEWCVDTFAPYAEYDNSANWKMSDLVIGKLYKISDECLNSTVSYMNEHLEFCKKVMGLLSYSEDTAEYVAAAIKGGYDDAAKTIFETVLSDFSDDWKEENKFIDNVIRQCRDYYNECETMEYFRDKLFPLLDRVKDPMVRDEFDVWKKEIDEYIDDVYDNCPKYAYLGKNSWRREVPRGKNVWLDPCDYDSKEEYMEAYNEEKYGWRKYQSEYEGLDPKDYETEEEYSAAVDEKRRKDYEEQALRRREQTAKRIAERKAAEMEAKKPDFSKIYNVVGAVFDESGKVYTYFCDDDSVKIGDRAIVVTADGEAEVTIVSKGECVNTALPLPAKYIKTIKKAQ